MLHIEFEYADKMSNWKWRRQCCTVTSLEQCKKLYGLGVDCEYRILTIIDMDKNKAGK